MDSKMKRIFVKTALPNIKVKIIVYIANKSTSKPLMTAKHGFSAISAIDGFMPSVLISIFIICTKATTKM